MDKEFTGHIQNGTLLSYLKKKKRPHISVISNEVDELRTYYTELSKSDRERQTVY